MTPDGEKPFMDIPPELRQLRQWVVHKNKIPHNPRTGYRVSVTNPKSWSTFEEAVQAFQRGGFDGIGFVFTKDDPYSGIDFDHCIDARTGEILPWVLDWVQKFGSYVEFSISGTGLHTIVKGSVPAAVKTKNAEIYSENRFFCMTGNNLGEVQPIRDAQPELDKLYSQLKKPAVEPPSAPVRTTGASTLTEDEIIEKASNAANGEKFKTLFRGDISSYSGDHSRGDMALCNELAFWCGGDIEQMDRIFRRSGLMRPKWDRPQSGSTYGRLQLEKAAAEQCSRYDPEQYRREQAVNDFTPEKPERPPGLQIISAAELAEKHLDPIRYFVDGLLPQGLALLSSPPKYGKSWFVLDLCLSICKGKDFLGNKTNKTECLYLALEDSENRLKSRMLKVLDGDPAPENFKFTINAPDLDNGLAEQLESYIQQNPGTGVIVIDTLQKIRGSARRTESAYTHDYRDIGAIKALADQYKILILLVHHLRKMADDADPQNRISGTNGILGAADTSLVLSRVKRSDDETMLSITGRDVFSDDLVLKFGKDECRWRRVGTTQEVAARNAAAEYEESTLVQTLRYILKNAAGGTWRGTISRLIEESRGFPFEIREPPRKVSNILKDLEPDLSYYDSITFYPWKKGSNGGGREYVFSIKMPSYEEWTGYNETSTG